VLIVNFEETMQISLRELLSTLQMIKTSDRELN